MTFSIVAKCPETGQFGVAAATGVPAVGKLLTHAFTGLGAIATQAYVNPYLGIDGLSLLAEGLSADEVATRLQKQHPHAHLRQFAVVDAAGRTAAWTGSQCQGWAGHYAGELFSVQGNRLAGPQVLDAVREAFLDRPQDSLDCRFIAALEAGDRAGGDRKEERSATIYIVEKEEYPLWDIRVDDHDHPIVELKRLHTTFAESVLPAIRKMPTRANPAGDQP